MFAMKSMGDSLLKLKLDMVYRDLPVEEAKKRYDDLPAVSTAVVAKQPRKRMMIKALVPP
jgi:hypothetical protein